MSEVAAFVMDERDARRLTEKIRLTAQTYAEAREKLIDYVEQAREGNAHLALGYRSWTEYLSEVLGEEPMRLARDERREVVQLLSGEGMSTRAIAPIVGVHDTTVHRDLAAGAANAAPEPAPSVPTPAERVDLPNVGLTTGEIPDEDEDVAEYAPQTPAEAVAAADDAVEAEPEARVESLPTPRPPVTGMDGKTYQRPQNSGTRRPPLIDAFSRATYDLRKALDRVARLTDDDRFPQNAEKVATAHRSDLIRARDLLEQVINRLPEA